MSFKFRTVLKYISLNLRSLLLFCYNLKILKFLRQFMDYFLRYPDIKQTKHRIKKVYCALVFLGIKLKIGEDLYKHII